MEKEGGKGSIRLLKEFSFSHSTSSESSQLMWRGTEDITGAEDYPAPPHWSGYFGSGTVLLASHQFP